MKKTEPVLWGADRKVCDDAAQYPEYTLGRILSQEKDLYRMITAEGEYLAKVSGKFRYQAAHPSDFPAVGDFVMAGGIGKGTQAVCQDHKNNGIRDHWNRRNPALSFGGNNRSVFRFFRCGKIHAGQPTAWRRTSCNGWHQK